MIQVIRADKRHKHESDWLSSYWLFSFANYVDKKNISFGNLRVFNDDTVKPGKGFQRHEHENMEIVTIPLEGELTHTDSIGNTSLIKAGEIQVISAGSGISHAEMNLSETETRFLQLWFFSDAKDIVPTYKQKSFSLSSNLIPLASGKKNAELTMNSDATVYFGSLHKSEKMHYLPDLSRKVFLYVIKGSLLFDNIETPKPKFDYREERRLTPMKLVLQAGDQARITEKEAVHLIAQEDAKFVLVDSA